MINANLASFSRRSTDSSDSATFLGSLGVEEEEHDVMVVMVLVEMVVGSFKFDQQDSCVDD